MAEEKYHIVTEIEYKNKMIHHFNVFLYLRPDITEYVIISSKKEKVNKISLSLLGGMYGKISHGQLRRRKDRTKCPIQSDMTMRSRIAFKNRKDYDDFLQWFEEYKTKFLSISYMYNHKWMKINSIPDNATKGTMVYIHELNKYRFGKILSEAKGQVYRKKSWCFFTDDSDAVLNIIKES